MSEIILEHLIEILPVLARITGSQASVTDLQGYQLCTMDSNGHEVREVKGLVNELAARAGREGRLLIGKPRASNQADSMVIPIGNYVLSFSNAQRVEREERLRSSVEKSLPMIAQVTGGEAVLFNYLGQRLISFNSDGSERSQYKGSISNQAREAMETQELIFGKSFSISGAMAVRIPITEQFGLGLNNEDATQQQQKLYEEVKRLQHTRYTFEDIIGDSEALARTKSTAKFVSNGTSSILICGETGTGKELFAQSIHNASERSNKPFIALNCGALPGSLIESNLFGYEEGAFTGAKKGGSLGAFEQANNGTIFLDEISEMELSLQTKLLRVLQEREVVRVGGFRPIKVNVRVIASTNKDLNMLIAEGKFRQDLFYRLNVVQIKVPAIRERPTDISLLARYFVNKYNTLFGKLVVDVGHETLKILQQHPWPGNVRELQNCIESAMNMVERDGAVLLPNHLPVYVRQNPKTVKASVLVEIGTEGLGLKQALAETEKAVIQKALEIAKYKKVKTAQILGISTPTLWRKMTEYGMEQEEDK